MKNSEALLKILKYSKDSCLLCGNREIDNKAIWFCKTCGDKIRFLGELK